MALLSRDEITEGLKRLGELAFVHGTRIELIVVGGAAMALAFDARESTRDVDVVILSPKESAMVRALAAQVGEEKGWPAEWLNDGAKGFLSSISLGRTLLSEPGISVRSTSVEQMLALKLSAWRDDLDICDAKRIMAEIKVHSGQDRIWKELQAYLVPGCELKARYAFLDLWEEVHGRSD